MESHFSFEELRCAFQLRIVHMIMTADELVHPRELDFLEHHFSRELLAQLAFVDPAQQCFTPRFDAAAAAAPSTLSSALTLDDKRFMIRFFGDACRVDGETDPRELSVVVQAARMIDFPQEELVRELSGITGHDTVTVWAPRSRRAQAGAPSTDAGPPFVVVTRADVRADAWEPIEAMLSAAAREGRLLELAGRCRVSFESWPGFDGPPHDHPELRAWLSTLAVRYPWLPVWLEDTDDLAGSLVAASLPCDVGDPNYAAHFVSSAVQCANYGVALTHLLGGRELDHVYGFLAQFEITDIPAGYFDGVDVLADELGPDGRHRLAP